nr:hypothetical protein NNONMNKP_00089 [Oryctes rhinoceros nudivirus]
MQRTTFERKNEGIDDWRRVLLLLFVIVPNFLTSIFTLKAVQFESYNR